MPLFKTPDGVSLHYVDTKTPGPTVLLQHGFSADIEQILEIIPASNIRLIAMDLRGHGLSETGKPEYCTIEQSYRDLAGLCLGLNIVPQIIGGISLGAAIALRYASQIENQHLIIARPAIFDQPTPPNFAIFGALLKIITEQPKSAWTPSLLALPAFKDLQQKAPATMDTYLRFLQHSRINDLYHWMCNLKFDWHGVSLSDMHSLSTPTTVIAQRDDQLHPYSFAVAFAKAIPNARLVEMSPKASNTEIYQYEFKNALEDIFQSIF